MPSRRVFVLYVAGLVQGLIVVTFAASAPVLKQNLALSDATYGGLFVPLTGLTLVASLVGGRLSHRFGLGNILAASLVSAALGAVALVAAHDLGVGPGTAALYTGVFFIGSGFGLAVAPLNALPILLVPRRPDSALVAMHMILAAGLSSGPALVGMAIAANAWTTFPWATAAAAIALAAIVARADWPREPVTDAHDPATEGPAPSLAIFGLIVVLYALLEAILSNWATVYLAEDRGVDPATAALALAAFWGGVAGGRFLVSFLVARIAPRRFWALLPAAIGAATLAVAFARTGPAGVAAFALAGLTCAGFFPLTVSLASRLPGRGPAQVSAFLTACLMVGAGGGTWLVGLLRAAVPLESQLLAVATLPITSLALTHIALRSIQAASTRSA